LFSWRDVRQNKIARRRVKTVWIAKIFADRMIRKMASAAEDALLNYPRVRAHLEHVQIVIGFQDEAIRPRR